MQLLAEKAKAETQPTAAPGPGPPVLTGPDPEPAVAGPTPAVAGPAPAVPAGAPQAAFQLPVPVSVPTATPLLSPPVDPSLAWKLEKMELQVILKCGVCDGAASQSDMWCDSSIFAFQGSPWNM